MLPCGLFEKRIERFTAAIKPFPIMGLRKKLDFIHARGL